MIIWPQARARATRSGDEGSHRVRENPHSSSTARPPSTATEATGWAFTCRSTSEPAATAPQKKSVALVPRPALAGTEKLVSRQLSPAQVKGSVHWVLSLGPVGPLKTPLCCSPQRPSNPSQGWERRSSARAVGTVATAGVSVREGPRESSQPTPSAWLRMR